MTGHGPSARSSRADLQCRRTGVDGLSGGSEASYSKPPSRSVTNDHVVTSHYWPVFGLRLQTPRLELVPITEADLEDLADLLPHDAEPDPSRPRHAVSDPQLDRGIALFQSYWSSLGRWRPDHWRLGFTVRLLGGAVVGVQELEARDFPLRRVVESSSWLVAEARGKGVGREMRAAVLNLAFSGLGAMEAESGAWWDNGASLGVSAALGYRPNGEFIHVDGNRRDRMVRVRLSADDWGDIARSYPTVIRGLEACRHLFTAE